MRNVQFDKFKQKGKIDEKTIDLKKTFSLNV